MEIEVAIGIDIKARSAYLTFKNIKYCHKYRLDQKVVASSYIRL